MRCSNSQRIYGLGPRDALPVVIERLVSGLEPEIDNPLSQCHKVLGSLFVFERQMYFIVSAELCGLVVYTK